MKKWIALSACMGLGACLNDPSSTSATVTVKPTPMGHWQATKDTSMMGSPVQAIVDFQLTKDSSLIQIQALGMTVATLQGTWRSTADSLYIDPSKCQSLAMTIVNGQTVPALQDADCAQLQGYAPKQAAWKLKADSLVLSQKNTQGQEITLSFAKK